MPKETKIADRAATKLYSIEKYPWSYLDTFSATLNFEKWATAEVPDYAAVPEDMETLTVLERKYADLIREGPGSDGRKNYSYIFGPW